MFKATGFSCPCQHSSYRFSSSWTDQIHDIFLSTLQTLMWFFLVHFRFHRGLFCVWVLCVCETPQWGGVKSETSEWGGGGSSETDFLTSSERKFSTNEEGAEKKGGLNRNSEGGFLRSSGLWGGGHAYALLERLNEKKRVWGTPARCRTGRRRAQTCQCVHACVFVCVRQRAACSPLRSVGACILHRTLNKRISRALGEPGHPQGFGWELVPTPECVTNPPTLMPREDGGLSGVGAECVMEG